MILFHDVLELVRPNGKCVSMAFGTQNDKKTKFTNGKQYLILTNILQQKMIQKMIQKMVQKMIQKLIQKIVQKKVQK